MIVKDPVFRMIVGGWTVFLGLILLKLYFDRDKETLWGEAFRVLKQVGIRRGPTGADPARIVLVLGIFAVAAGLIAMLFGFRIRLVGF